MVFSSLIFLLFFLTALYVCYFIVPRRWLWLRNCVMLVFCLFFYLCGGAHYLSLLLAYFLINYFVIKNFNKIKVFYRFKIIY